MRNFSDIKHRIKSISDTRKITGAMETISVAKMRKALNRYENNKAYFETIRSAINDIALYTHNAEHKIFAESQEHSPAFIIIASDKGLAGGFNHNVLRFAEEKISAYKSVRLFMVGQVANEYFESRGYKADDSYSDASFEPSIEQAAQIGEEIYALFESGAVDCAYVIYTAIGEHNAMFPQSIKLLPFDSADVIKEKELSADKKKYLHEFIYEPSAEEVLETLLPQYLTGMIFGTLIQSSACEHSQRRSAMNSATRNATRILDGLNLEYNRARQESVTGELIEIVTAANGVKTS